MKLTVDRFENDLVICEIFETQEFITLEKNLFTDDIKEGDIVNFEDDTITLDIEETESTAERIKSKMDSLWE